MNLWGEEEGIVSNAGLEQIKEVKNKYKIGKKKKKLVFKLIALQKLKARRNAFSFFMTAM